MRARVILSEAGRNVLSGTTRAGLLGVFLALVCAGLAVVDARSIIDLRQAAAAYVASGASVRVLKAPDGTDGAACERLGTLPGVRAAGAIRETDAVVLRTMIANPLPAYAVTPGLVTVLGGAGSADAGAWIPRTLAAALGVTPGQEVPTTTGTMRIAGVYDYPDDGRDSRLSHAALIPQPPTGRFDECWADVWPTSPQREHLLYSAIRVDTDSTDPVAVGQLNNSLGKRFDGVTAFDERPTRWALPGCVLAGLLVGFAAVRMRRLELAAALHLGETRRALLLTLLIETLLWASGAFVLSAFALACAVLPGNTGDPLAVYAIDVRGPLAALPAAAAGTALALCTVREAHLFRYFKNR
ncbi:hypothetical protein Val02_53260 [Virgisporangium aliadipatigenens]|uniref:Uncharacterized protein n=1 Tax=Virgisporangium aliadipatigenens TaxID=741659 RepID=A0A8J3YR71_9ACTN|nr:hypothetical protein [Virgisporangium aliadipatigenens]GIJ48440.1 hypothetical protein Val02_53260 [Virgisporangium aliadipatigenens]